MKKKQFLIPLFVLVGACVISLAYSIVDYKVINKQPSYSYQTIQFNFDGASDGKDPNGNPFNAVDFLTDDVIAEAVSNSGLTYSVDDVRNNIVVTNVVPSDIINEINDYASVTDKSGTKEITSNDYHPTKYKFTLYQDLDNKLKSDKLNDLLNNIVDGYCNKFYSTYKKSYDGSAYDALYSIDEYDYIFQSQIYSNKIDILMEYAKNIYNEHIDFQTKDKNGDDRSFNDIYLAGNQLLNSYVRRIENLITLNALSNDLPRLKDYYNYKIEMLQNDKTKYESDLAAVSAQVAAYKKDSTIYVGSGENIVKIESNSAETYNALLAKQIELNDKIASINTDIADCTAILDDINAAASSQEDYDLVKSYLARLGESFDALEETFVGFIGAYNEAYLRDGTSKTSVQHQSNSIFSGSFIMRAIKDSAAIILAALLGIGIYYLALAIKLQKLSVNKR